MTAKSTSGGTRQRDSFLGGEGDRWLQRNDGQYMAEHTRFALESLLRFVRSTDEILEVGCGSGRNLAWLSQSCPGVVCHGLDPSAAAVRAAGESYPFLNVRIGSADALPYRDRSFDVLIFGFCLYLVDRELLLRVAAEADRVLKDRGFLAIVDFDPLGPRKRRYRHLEGMFSYKMDYPKLFISSGHYHLAGKASYSHGGASFHADPAERIATTILFKDLEAGYTPEDD